MEEREGSETPEEEQEEEFSGVRGSESSMEVDGVDEMDSSDGSDDDFAMSHVSDVRRIGRLVLTARFQRELAEELDATRKVAIELYVSVKELRDAVRLGNHPSTKKNTSSRVLRSHSSSNTGSSSYDTGSSTSVSAPRRSKRSKSQPIKRTKARKPRPSNINAMRVSPSW